MYSSLIAFTALSDPLFTYTAARREFIGRNGTPSAPAALARSGMTKDTGDTIDPCAAMQVRLELAPGETHKIAIVLGACRGEDEAMRLIQKYRDPDDAVAALDSAARVWHDRLSLISVKTPEGTFDTMLNGWTLYQALSCRMWTRAGLYQWSGAYGFRDQLQDVMAFVYSEPAIAREHILLSASRQFEEGDVQHWWHPQSGRGIRTRFSDDLIWLPYVVNHYLSVTNDTHILDEKVRYLRMRELNPGEQELFEEPEISELSESLYDHCARALKHGCTVGEHGLPLMGTGDWNDGMNRVGVDGKGESVWLAWFLIATLTKFAEHAIARGDQALHDDLLQKASNYTEAAERAGWDGEWYRRAYFDDGEPLGSAQSDDCKIDSIAQTWSIISHAGRPEHVSLAMKSVNEMLVRDDSRVIMLLAPPFTNSKHDPGYIQGYLPGVRENGAQYTHAALWVVLATAMQGDGNRAFELYQMINPMTRSDSPEAAGKYKVEPYVVAADVYTAQGHLGRGGWTWYTGSASWMYRVGLEGILGFKKRGDTLEMDPCIPSDWPEFTLAYRHGSSTYTVSVKNPDGVQRGVVTMEVDGARVDGPVVLKDDNTRHDVIVTLGHPSPPRPEA